MSQKSETKPDPFAIHIFEVKRKTDHKLFNAYLDFDVKTGAYNMIYQAPEEEKQSTPLNGFWEQFIRA